MFSISQTSSNLLVYAVMPSGNEIPLGFVINLNLEVSQGQRVIFGVDSPFPVQIAQAAQPSIVRGVMNIVLLKSTTPESLNLIAGRNNAVGDPINIGSHYIHFRIFDRASRKPIYTIFQAKIGGFNLNIPAQSVVTCQLAFDAAYLVPHTI